MKFRQIFIVSIVILLYGFSVQVPAMSAEKGVRPCLTSDLIGTWELRNISSRIKIGPDDSFGWPYQRFAFDIRGDVKEMVSTTPIESNKAAVQKFEKTASTSKFMVNERGVLTITKIESPQPEQCMCAYAIKDVPAEKLVKIPESKRALIPHLGDVVLTYLNRSGQPLVIKSLRKV